MISTETLRDRQEDIDWRREQNVKELKTQWNNYTPQKQVKFIREYPEIAEQILILLNNI